MTAPQTPPRTAERLLEALGAEPELRDALLGDLAEDFATRAADQGERAARRRYWREALRAAPYLLH
ncbi:MAG TPA: permease prefix domain 2-containing transporter, partial [Longimicrobiaceae bacterium]